MTQGTDGNFYVISAGTFVAPCAVLKLTPEGSLTILYDFGTGFSATGLVQAIDGNLYTVLQTTTGSAIYRVTLGGAATMIHQFASDLSEGYLPISLIPGADGNLYGTNFLGGAPNGLGTFYKVTLSGQLTVLHDFTFADGVGGASYLVQATDGNFYGSEGTGGYGLFYKLTSSGDLTTLPQFTAPDGQVPNGKALIQAANGSFYGTLTGGENGESSIFEITPSGEYTLVYAFPLSSGTKSVLVQAPDGSFYGTAYGQNNVYGSVFRLAPDSTFSTVYTFGLGDDGYAPEGLILGKDGNLYGLTFDGGATEGGTAYQLTLGGSPPALSINPGGVVSASAFGEFTSAAPGTWIEIYGSNLAADTRSWMPGDFTGINAPTSLEGTYVTIGGQQAFVEFISPGQVNALIPSNVPAGAQQVTVTTSAGTTPPYSLIVNSYEPGLLAPPSFNISGTQYVVAQFGDGTYVLPTGAISGIDSRPANPGDIIVIYGVGFGPVTPAVPAGQLVQEENTLASDFHISLGGMECQVLYDGLAPNYTGLYQFNIVVPSVASGNAPLTLTVGGVAGTQVLQLAIGN